MKLFISLLLPLCNVACAAFLKQSDGSGLLVHHTDSSRSEKLRQQTHATRKRQTEASSRLTLTNHKGIQYTAPVSLGGQELQAVYDTGSFEVMAIAKQCSVCQLHADQHAYDSSSSKTFERGSHDIEKHNFAGGTVKAREDYETVHVGLTDSVLKVERMPFWQVVETDMHIFLNKKANFTAIVGMGHRNNRPDSDSESLIERAGVQKFSICLIPGLANAGYLTFNPSHNFADAGFQKLTVIGEKHWAVSLDHVQTDLNGTPLHSCWVFGGQPSCVAIIDSGTSLIGVPPLARVMIKTLIQRIKYDCSNLDDLPDLVFVLDGKKFSLPARAYTIHFGMLNGKPYRCLPAFTDVSMSLKGSDVWILGIPFLRYFHTTFDRGGPSIYVADQAANCEPALSNNGVFLDTSTRKGSYNRQQPPSFADLREARLPSWAVGGNAIDL